MTASHRTTSRRAFFVSGGAVLGAGVAGVAGAAAVKDGASTGAAPDAAELQRQLARAEDREAIRRVYLAFVEHMEQQRYGAVARLFDAQARLRLGGEAAVGREAIEQLLATDYAGQQGACLHRAYRQTARQQHDAVTVSEDGCRATAVFHVEVELVSPLQGESSAAVMARLQGHVADRRWERGRLEASYVRAPGGWAIASLEYRPA